ncbi:hypothetical protein FEM48_Zijuj09G0116000 [Ziziphus jujuba var. spinosa]|uniref:Non-haem dioxygenase N-terminal domain-containing protein n=1 Tax=Ziziphus jujuba var. spinosa TaxID=714518 RepID=A0A978USS6_ZIZJJ|nr:hypothetical protein FEM48_Zijuj09G0116000 [Ziziphus jujuba var. spinosa]
MGEVGEIDAAFIQEPEDRPKPSMEAQGIPLIDLSAVVDSSSSSSSDHPEAIEKVVREIGNACKDWGFFQVANHGVPIEIRQKMETAARQFFVQPLELKMKVRRDDPMVFGYMKPSVPRMYYRSNQNRDACEEYSKEVEKLSLKLMELIAVSLGLRANRFSGFFEEHTSIVRMTHYPPCPSPYLALTLR